jgi:hypothetical protein
MTTDRRASMRGLLRCILAFLTLGFSTVGCNKPSDDGPDDSPFHASFRVPGMT